MAEQISSPGAYRLDEVSKQEERGGDMEPAHATPDTLLRLVVNDYGRAPASARTIIGAVVNVEPDVDRIRGVSGGETRSCKLEGGACSQRAEVGALRRAPGATGGRSRALIDQRTLLVG